jgi:nicotinamide-nucleotide amidase
VIETFESDVLALGERLRARRWMLASAESCTGGLIAAACTSVAGSSDWFERGFVTYSNDAKVQCLGVPAGLVAAHGAVSEPVAQAMAEGALRLTPAQLAVAVTGVAGPGGGTPDKPVGLVWLAWGSTGRVRTERFRFDGDRTSVRMQTVRAALERLLEAAG